MEVIEAVLWNKSKAENSKSSASGSQGRATGLSAEGCAGSTHPPQDGGSALSSKRSSLDRKQSPVLEPDQIKIKCLSSDGSTSSSNDATGSNKALAKIRRAPPPAGLLDAAVEIVQRIGSCRLPGSMDRPSRSRRPSQGGSIPCPRFGAGGGGGGGGINQSRLSSGSSRLAMADGGAGCSARLLHPPGSSDGNRPSCTSLLETGSALQDATGRIWLTQQDVMDLATYHDSVTILFADIKGFTSLSQELHPAQVGRVVLHTSVNQVVNWLDVTMSESFP